MKVRYSTNWMGPVSLNWYEKRGLDYNTQRYSCGRIDVRGGNTGTYGDEIAVPPMVDDDWHLFGEWLTTYETDDILTLEQLVYVYELKNPKIRWWKENE